MDPGNPLKAAFWMMGAVASFAAMTVAGRELQAEMNTFELMLYRSVIGLAVVLIVLTRSRDGFKTVRSPAPGLHVRRNLVHYAGQNLWFFAVATIPLAQLTALEFTNPLWVTVLAPFLLGERLTRTGIAALVVGFAGILVVARPGTAPFGPGHAAALTAAILFALNTIFTKQIMARDGVLCVLFWMTLSQSAMSLALALPGGIPWPTAPMLPWILLVGVTGLSAHFALTSALGHAPASVVAPMEFIRLPVIAIVGALLYGEPLETAVFVGAALIIGANLVNLRAGTRARAEA